MATNSATTAFIVGAGALTDFAMRGQWTWRSFFLSTSGAVVGYFIAVIILYYLPSANEAPSEVRIAIAYFCGFFAHKVVHRINRMTLKASVGGVEVESRGDD